MAKFLIRGRYSGGSWARMIARRDDRTLAVRALMDSFGGSLDALYWEVETAAAYALVDLPDTVAAAAVVTAISKSGAFVGVEVHELLSQSQLNDVLVLAGDAAKVYKVPGYAAVGAVEDGVSSDGAG